MPIGIPAAMLLSSVIGAGASVAGSALSGKGKTATQTGSSTPTLSPEMQGTQDKIRAVIEQMLSDPSAGLGPVNLAGKEAINRRYRDVGGSVSSALAQRGYGSSSQLPGALFKTEMSRFGDLSDWDSKMAQQMLNQKNTAITQGTNLVRQSQGTETTGSQTQPGNSVANGLLSAGNGMENLSTMYMLNKMLNPSGGVQAPQGYNPNDYSNSSSAIDSILRRP